MPGFMKSVEGHTYALVRIVTGFLFLWHGAQKLVGFPMPPPEAPALVLYVGGPIELVGGTLIMIGLFTRWAAFIAAGEMAAAYWMAHATQALHPMQNQGELAILYCFIFLYIAATGGGRWSIDAVRTSG